MTDSELREREQNLQIEREKKYTRERCLELALDYYKLETWADNGTPEKVLELAKTFTDFVEKNNT